MYDIIELKKKKLQDLQEIANKLEISNLKDQKKLDLIYQILDQQALVPASSSVQQKETSVKKVKTQNKPQMKNVNERKEINQQQEIKSKNWNKTNQSKSDNTAPR